MAGGGKALRHGEKVLTPEGFKNIEDIRVGDSVVTPSNTIESVTDIWPQGIVQLYEVVFQDGRVVETCGEHLWKFHLSGNGKSYSKVGNTLEFIDRLGKLREYGKGSPIIPLCSPLELQKQNLLIPPYTLGVILGDGHIDDFSSTTVTNMDDQVFEEMQKEGTVLGNAVKKQGTDAVVRYISGIRSSIRELGLEGKRSSDKFIPEAYKVSTIEDRFSIIQGLMDTDGYVSPDGKTYYYTISDALKNDVREILHSLGFTVTVTVKKTGYKKGGEYFPCQDCYCLYIRGKNQQRLFKLDRKINRTKEKDVGLKVVSVIKSCKDYATCIAITGNEKLFVTSNYIVTHNSTICLMKNLDALDDETVRCTVLRKSAPELKRQGGLVSESQKLYEQFGAVYNKTQMVWTFPNGAEVQFGAIPDSSVLGGFQGLQASRFLIDEVGDDWELDTVLFLLTRLRSAGAKHKAQMIMTCNPNPNSFLVDWLDYCLDKETGVPIEGTENIVRWFIVLDGKVLWASSAEECFDLHGRKRGMVYGLGLSDEDMLRIPPDKLFLPKSFRFIPLGVYQNPYLLPPKNNTYLANLLSQPKKNQLKFLHGSWKNIDVGQGHFSRDWCRIIKYHEVPDNLKLVRAYDLAASEKNEVNRNPDSTVGVLLGRDSFGNYYVIDVVSYQERPHTVLQNIAKQSLIDGQSIPIVIPKDSGAGGTIAAQHFVSTLSEAGCIVKLDVMSGHSGKLMRGIPFCQLAEAGMVSVVDGEWNEEYFSVMESFLGTPESMRKVHDDHWDATASGFKFLARQNSMPTFELPDFSKTSSIPS